LGTAPGEKRYDSERKVGGDGGTPAATEKKSKKKVKQLGGRGEKIAAMTQKKDRFDRKKKSVLKKEYSGLSEL